MPKASRDALNAKGKTDVYYFDPADVVLVEDQKSALYDERVDNEVKEGLVLNMMFAPDGVPQGVLTVLAGRRNAETGKIEIVDGRHRTKAAREANKRLKKAGLEPIRLPVQLKRSNDQRLMAMMISANEHSTEDSPMNKAKKMQRYVELGRDEKELAALFGMSEASVKNHLRLLEAPAVVRNAVDAGKITASDAYKLAREEPEEAKKKLGKLLEHAPRTPGKKRSKNAKKAREIVSGNEARAKRSADENRVEAWVVANIADWIEKTWNDETWGGAPREIPARIRAGEWRA